MTKCAHPKFRRSRCCLCGYVKAKQIEMPLINEGFALSREMTESQPPEPEPATDNERNQPNLFEL